MNTTHDAIVAHWVKIQDECGLPVDWSEALDRCWKCAERRTLQRCHIIPRSIGGKDTPDNLVLLCADCHGEAPNVADASFIWRWIRSEALPCYGSHKTARAFAAYRIAYGEEPGSRLDDAGKDRAARLIREMPTGSCSTHFGQVGANATTIAWMIRRAEDAALAGA